MKNKGYLLISLGTVFVMAALILLLYNNRLENKAKIAADKIIPKLMQEIDSKEETGLQSEITTNDVIPSAVPKATSSSEIEVDKHNYIGIINIPSLQLKLPVLSDYVYRDLNIAPCRYSGDISGKFVIAAHNYKAHFGSIYKLSKGDILSFTNTNNEVVWYKVELVEELSANAVEEMVDSSWDLTLFTCNFVGDKRITVRCSKKE